jgi:hypothetical protein
MPRHTSLEAKIANMFTSSYFTVCTERQGTAGVQNEGRADCAEWLFRYRIGSMPLVNNEKIYMHRDGKLPPGRACNSNQLTGIAREAELRGYYRLSPRFGRPYQTHADKRCQGNITENSPDHIEQRRERLGAVCRIPYPTPASLYVTCW